MPPTLCECLQITSDNDGGLVIVCTWAAKWPSTLTLIRNASRGYPRAVNNLALNALTAAFARQAGIVDEKATRIAISETGAD